MISPIRNALFTDARASVTRCVVEVKGRPSVGMRSSALTTQRLIQMPCQAAIRYFGYISALYEADVESAAHKFNIQPKY